MDERYLLRVLSGAGRPARATLRDLRDGSLSEFAALEDLFAHLRELADAGTGEDDDEIEATGTGPEEVKE